MFGFGICHQMAACEAFSSIKKRNPRYIVEVLLIYVELMESSSAGITDCLWMYEKKVTFIV